MKNLLIVTVLWIIAAEAYSQNEYRVPKKEGKLVLTHISNVRVEGYEGNEIIFTVQHEGKKAASVFHKPEDGDDPRAQGLSTLDNNGFDNTGLNLKISEEGKNIFVSPVGNLDGLHVKIQLPKAIALSVKSNGILSGLSDGQTIYVSHLDSEVSLSGQFENCKLVDVSGPLSIKTFSGNVEVVLKEDYKGPVSIQTINGFIDLAIPENAKANLSLATLGGVIYADPKLRLEPKNPEKKAGEEDLFPDAANPGSGWFFDFDAEKGNSDTPSGNNRKDHHFNGFPLPFSIGRSSFEGTLNGGGQRIYLRSMGGKIYLRK